jgi:hypothetical protein
MGQEVQWSRQPMRPQARTKSNTLKTEALLSLSLLMPIILAFLAK